MATKTSVLLAALENAASRARTAIAEIENNRPDAAKREIRHATEEMRTAIEGVKA